MTVSNRAKICTFSIDNQQLRYLSQTSLKPQWMWQHSKARRGDCFHHAQQTELGKWSSFNNGAIEEEGISDFTSDFVSQCIGTITSTVSECSKVTSREKRDKTGRTATFS